MGVLRFRLPPGNRPGLATALARAYVTGLDRAPERAAVELRGELLAIHRERMESGRVHVAWPVRGFGTPVLSTATLTERAEPYQLAVELARGKLNDVTSQTADWMLLGLQAPSALEPALREARRAFGRAATSQDDPAVAAAAADESLEASHRAARILLAAYTEQVLARRIEHSPSLPTLLACGIAATPKGTIWSTPVLEAINAAKIRCDWAMLAPEEGQYRWDDADAQIRWCRKKRLTPLAGPIVDLRPDALPHWLWLWEGDFDAIAGMVTHLVKHAVGRYRGKIASWHVVGRPGTEVVLGLSEEEQFELTARALRTARATDPDAHLVVDFDQPWADWMANSRFRLGPLYLADNLARSEVGLSGIGLEIAPGFSPPGSPMRDILDFSKLLDLFAVLNRPLHLSMAAPSSAASDPLASKGLRVEADQWPSPPSPAAQAAWVEEWVALAIAKPFVRSLTWIDASDSVAHSYPHAGLFDAEGVPKPAFDWLRGFRKRYLG